MPSAATTFTNNNSKEKRASVSSLGASSSVGGGSGVGGVACNTNNGPHSSHTNLADCVKNDAPLAATLAGSQTDLTNNNAANIKALKLSANAVAEPYNPMKQILVTIEHKIRNLEKRKTKLESYRAIQSGGKELSADQAAAVAKYDSVQTTLEFAREFAKQTQLMFKDVEKEQKKQARKDNIAKALAETAKIRDILVMQNVLICFNDEQVRNDFLSGENGACKLETNELKTLEKFFMEAQTRRPETSEDVSFLTTAQKAAELFAMTINARAKPYGELSFDKVRALFQQIQDSGYLDKYYFIPDQAGQVNSTDCGAISADGETLNEVATVAADQDALISETSAHNSVEEGLDKLSVVEVGASLAELQQPERSRLLLDTQHQRSPIDQQQLVAQQQPGVYNAVNATAGNTTPVHVMYAATAPAQQQVQQATLVSQQTQQTHPHQLLSSPVNLQALHSVPASQPSQAGVAAAPVVPPQQQQSQRFGPTTVRAVEHTYFKQPQPTGVVQAPSQQQQFMQQLRPLADMLGNGSFHFLQDSELDAPEVLPTQQQQAQPPQQLPVQGLVFEQQQQQQQNHVNESQPITTLTFTNQSYPSLQQQPQQQQQLFSPVLIHEQQRQQQQPMLIMTRLPPQQQATAPAPQAIGMQPGDVTAVFPYENVVVSYEQQLQQQLGIKPQPPQHEEQPLQKQLPLADVETNEWHGRSGVNDTNAAATAALTNVLKTQSSALAEQTAVTPAVASNKWSSEVNAMSSAASNGSNSSNSNKQDWATPRDNSNGRGGFANDNDSINNHWISSSQQQDNSSQVRRNSGNYQRRNGGGDERGRNCGNYRARQYGNSASAQQQNGRNSGVYFRNNESSGGGSNNNYYQNGSTGGNSGGGGVYNKESRYEGSGSYRVQRGGNQRNNNTNFARTMGDRGRNTGGGGSGNGNGSSGVGGGYLNHRQTQQQQRMPLGLENKN